MPKILDDVNKLVVIDKCILLFVEYGKKVSEFLGNTLESNYISYKDNINSSKRNRCLKNIDNNLDSLESKKYDINSMLEECRLYIKKCYRNDLVDSSYSRYLNSLLTDSYRETFNGFVKEYDSIVNNDREKKVVKKKKKTTKIQLPKITEEKKIEISYLELNNFIYMHMKELNEFPFMEFDEDSFKLEVDMYNDCLSTNKLTIFDDLNKYELSKLAPFEKKRRNYVRSMFKTQNKILNLKYDTEDYFKTCLDIVNNMYVELNDFDDNNSSLERLLKLTKQSYGGKKQLDSYKVMLDNIDIDMLVNCNFQDRYTIFNNVNNTVPTYDDIIKILNNKIIERVSSNINDYLNNIDKLFNNTCEYMSVDEIIKFYLEIKNVINVNSLLKNNNRKLIELQKYCCIKISKMLDIDEGTVLRDYLKEEKVY